MLSNAYFLAKIRFDTAENEPAKNLQNFANFPNFANPNPRDPRRPRMRATVAKGGAVNVAGGQDQTAWRPYPALSAGEAAEAAYYGRRPSVGISGSCLSVTAFFDGKRLFSAANMYFFLDILPTSAKFACKTSETLQSSGNCIRTIL